MSLEALERSDLSRLPGGIFTRAFVRAYAQEVGLDPDRTIQDFIAELPPEAATQTAHNTVIEDGQKLESDRKAVATAFRLVLVSLPIIGGVMYFGARPEPVRPSPAPQAVSSPPMALVVPEVERTGVAQVVTPRLEVTSGMRMEIAPRAACWVSVRVDGDPTIARLMNAGEKQVVTAKEQILISVGDAGAFAYTLNGLPGRPLGAPGEVVSTRITPSNLNQYVSP